MKRFNFTAGDGDSAKRLDIYLKDNLSGMTRSRIQALCEKGYVTADGKSLGKNYKIKPGDNIAVLIPEEDNTPMPQDIALDIIYEDNSIAIINKPKGLVVHPAAGNKENTLVNALLNHYGDNLSRLGGSERPGIIHRLDKETSGILIAAKTDEAHLKLAGQLKDNSMHRVYEAVVHGNIKEDNGAVEAPIGRDAKNRKRMAVTDKNSKNARTEYAVIQRCNGFTHISAKLITGRTHQIRVHFAHIGHPIAGDSVYGYKKAVNKLSSQCLYARTVGFIHPETNEYMEFSIDMPDYFKSFLNYCSNK